jgi:hypothetical protein
MDTTTLIILGVLAVAAIGAALYALNRSWGNFPRDARYQPRSGPSAPGISPSSGKGPRSNTIWDALPSESDLAAPPADAPDPLSWLVPITHPLMRRAAEQALQRGDGLARYVVRQGDQLSFDFSQISDLAQRRQAYTMMQRFADGQHVDIGVMLRLIQQLFSG